MATKQPLITPSPSPPSPQPTLILSALINDATKRHHIKLNKLIVDRLKLGLPPSTHDPQLLGYGLAAFARIYYTFETAWEKLHESVKSDTPLSGTHDAQVRAWLAYLRPNGLARSQRLEEDCAFISFRTNTHCDTLALPLQRKTLRRMRAAIVEKPHTLVAYAWVMYMATFSGGRWIRQQFTDAGPEFWTGNPGPSADEKGSLQAAPGFSFLSFDGNQDGEDIKVAFKSRLHEAETLLTQQERQDVIAAAIVLFKDCIALVEELDRAILLRKTRRTATVVLVASVVSLIALFLVGNWSLGLAGDW